MSYRFKFAATLLALSLAGTAVAQTPKVTRIRGDIVSSSADTLTVHRRSGDTVVIALKPELTVAAVKNVQLSDIKPGSFIGTAAKTGTDGKMTAMEVVVFPESLRGTGEGHYDWDLGSNSTMTNANVDSLLESTNGRELKLSHKGGTNDVTVPTNVPVVTIIPATRADLVAGKSVFVVATPGAGDHYTAMRVIVEKDGIKPPM